MRKILDFYLNSIKRFILSWELMLTAKTAKNSQIFVFSMFSFVKIFTKDPRKVFTKDVIICFQCNPAVPISEFCILAERVSPRLKGDKFKSWPRFKIIWTKLSPNWVWKSFKKAISKMIKMILSNVEFWPVDWLSEQLTEFEEKGWFVNRFRNSKFWINSQRAYSWTHFRDLNEDWK